LTACSGHVDGYDGFGKKKNSSRDCVWLTRESLDVKASVLEKKVVFKVFLILKYIKIIFLKFMIYYI